ncbi:MAG: hypothetical protein ACXIT9_13715 [Nitritalea sp.]
MDRLKLLHAGPFTSLQWLPNWEHLGVGWPLGGPMEPNIAASMRRLLGLPEDAAVLEFFLGGLQLEAPCALQGLLWTPDTNFQFQVGEGSASAGQFFSLAAGERLKVPTLKASYFGYLVFDRSLSPEESPTATRRLGQKTTLALGPKYQAPCLHARVKLPFFPIRKTPYVLPVVEGPDFHLLDAGSVNRLLGKPFQLAAQAFHRMGQGFVGNLRPHAHSLLSSPTEPGTLQWTPSGDLILLGPDAQVTGGYPRILYVPEQSRHALYRLAAAQTFIFSLNPKKSF